MEKACRMSREKYLSYFFLWNLWAFRLNIYEFPESRVQNCLWKFNKYKQTDSQRNILKFEYCNIDEVDEILSAFLGGHIFSRISFQVFQLICNLFNPYLQRQNEPTKGSTNFLLQEKCVEIYQIFIMRIFSAYTKNPASKKLKPWSLKTVKNLRILHNCLFLPRPCWSLFCFWWWAPVSSPRSFSGLDLREDFPIWERNISANWNWEKNSGI